jgi:ABC-type uncharacterized transport system involved in gliding motility auxiliary subunit
MKKNTAKFLSSFLALICIACILILINVIVGVFNVRLDMTDNKIYTLSQGSEKILSKLKQPIVIRFYFSRSNKHLPVQLKNFADRVEDLLSEYANNGNGNIIVEKYDPEPFSDAEDSALMDGIISQSLSSGENIYMGIAVSSGVKTETFPFISPGIEKLLEYKITSAISHLIAPKQVTIGILSALPVMGGVPTQDMIKNGIFEMSKPWLIIKELKKKNTLITIPFNTDKIENCDLLLILHPSEISEITQFAIDQFILKGGNVIAFLDPYSFYASTMEKTGRVPKDKTTSTLDKLLTHWNIKFNTKFVASDAIFSLKKKTATRELDYFTVLNITSEGLNNSDIITAPLKNMTMVFSGAFSGTPPENLKKEILIKTTENSCLLPTDIANDPLSCFRNFKAQGSNLELAISLTGKFTTAFPNGNPMIVNSDKKDSNLVKKSKKKSEVILIADSDMLYDLICYQSQQIYNQKVMYPVNDNINFLQNAVDSLCGDKDMIDIRCRPLSKRPFTMVKEIEAEAEKDYKEKILELENKLKNTEQKVHEMQKFRTEKNKAHFLTQEQQLELKKFREQQINIRQELKVIQKEYRKKVDALENKLKWFNIAMMPFIIMLFGLLVAMSRKVRNSAK